MSLKRSIVPRIGSRVSHPSRFSLFGYSTGRVPLPDEWIHFPTSRILYTAIGVPTLRFCEAEVYFSVGSSLRLNPYPPGGGGESRS